MSTLFNLKEKAVAIMSGKDLLLWIIVIVLGVIIGIGYFSQGKSSTDIVTELTNKIQKTVDNQLEVKMQGYKDQLTTVNRQLATSKAATSKLLKDVEDLKIAVTQNTKPKDRVELYHTLTELGYPPIRQ